MDTVIENPQPIKNIQQSNQQDGRQMFDDLSMSQENPFQNLQLSSELQPSEIPQQNEDNENDEEAVDVGQMMRVSKKQKKKQKKMRKHKQAKQRLESRKENQNQNIKKSDKKPTKKMMLDSQEQEADRESQHLQTEKINLKTKKNAKKQSKASDDDQKLKSDLSMDSGEYSSQENLSSEDDLQKMNPNNNDQDQPQGKKFKKKLGKKSRKQRILQRQGFDLKQLGNDGQANFELNSSVNQSDDSYSSSGKKKKGKGNKKVKKDLKQKKHKMTNEEFMDKLKQLGCEQEIQENDSARYNYDSGLNELQKLRPKKQYKNTIKVQNRMFGNLQMQIEQQMNNEQNQDVPQQEVPEDKLQLQFKPKVSSSRASSFLSKVEALKKHRGLEADVDQIQFDKMNKEKTKRSISQLVTKLQNQVEDNEDIDIQIKAPTIAKGKSADLINNTMYIVKSLSQKLPASSNELPSLNSQSNLSNEQQKLNGDKPVQSKIPQRVSNQSSSVLPTRGRKGVSRTQFFKQIKETISVRRSKFVSEEQLKNSMKTSKLQELQEIRKKIEEKRRKDAMYELGQVEDDDAENVIDNLADELARKQGISMAEYKKLLRDEENLEQLDEYAEDEDKKEKIKKDGVLQGQVEDNAADKTQQNQATSNTNNPKVNEKITLPPNPINKTKQTPSQPSSIQKTQKPDDSRHADDMIEQYEGLQEIQERQEQQMDLQEQKDYDQEADDEEGAHQDDDEGDEQEGQNDEEQQEEQESDAKDVQAVANGNEENPQMRQQLEDEGIIMPGANSKRRAHQSKPEQIDFAKYLAADQKGLIPEPIVVQAKQKTKEETLEFKEFKKLRKIAVVIQQKKKKRQEQMKRAKEFFEQQAELGSDNEENDDNVKAINKKDDEEQEDGDHLDQQLEQLIDNAVDINQANEEQAFRKYMEDVKEKDRQELQRILRGDFRRPNHDMPEMNEMEEDERERVQRMQKMVEWMQKREEDEKGMYAKDESEEDDQMNYYYDYNGNKKKIEKKNKNNENGQDNHEDTPEEDEQALQKKLQYYLMDTISPAKRQTDIEINNEFVTQLPTMFKKNTRTLISNFGKKSHQQSSNIMDQQQKQTQKRVGSNLLSFAGNLMNFSGDKNNKDGISSIPKAKKTTSHMSDYLNKNKNQKSNSFNGTSIKLPSIFGRVAVKKK